MAHQTANQRGRRFAYQQQFVRFGNTSPAYGKYILLCSWLRLRNENEIKIPKDIEKFIEDVYNQKLECFDESSLDL